MNHLKEIKRIKRYKKKKRYTNAEKGYLYELFMKYIFLFLLLSRKMSLYESENVLLSIKNKYLILKKNTILIYNESKYNPFNSNDKYWFYKCLN